MYALLGEKSVRIFEENAHVISYDDFFKKYDEKNRSNYNKLKKYRIIIDRTDIDFSLETLINCSIIDAYKFLHCQKKVMDISQDIFLLPNKKKFDINLFKKTDFCVQKNKILNKDFYQKINMIGETILIESIVAELCQKIIEIDEKTWWMYAAHHSSSGIKIIAGIGKGLILSRTLYLNFDENISKKTSDELTQTIKFLRRFGLNGQIKIITPMENIIVENQKVKKIKLKEFYSSLGLENHENCEDIELFLMDFLSKTPNIRIMFAKNFFIERFFRKNTKKILLLLIFCLLFLVAYSMYLKNQISNTKKSIFSLQEEQKTIIHDRSGNLRAQLDAGNFLFIKQFINTLKESRNPIDTIKKISEILEQNEITAEQFSIENGDLIKIKTSLNFEEEKRLKNLSDEKIEIIINMVNTNKEGEYEEIKFENSDKKHGAIICIKMK